MLASDSGQSLTTERDDTVASPTDVNAKLGQAELESFLDDMKSAPAWRVRADIEADYYDGNQLSAEDIQQNEERGLPNIVVNLIAPTINVVLGMEARTRTDWVVKPASPTTTERQAEALTEELNDIERNAYSDRACADAYASQIKTGLGWVETSYNDNPFEYPYRCAHVDRRQIWWDMRSNDPLLKDARWLMRKKWNDVDELAAKLPYEQQRLIDAALSAEAGWDMTRFARSFPYLQDSLVGRDIALMNEDEWRSSDRKRACAYEIWYRRYVRGIVLKYPDGRVLEYDKTNMMHNAAIVSGFAQVDNAVYPKMRLSWWLGPFRLYDIPSPFPHTDFPYTPFWGFREDRTGAPYGMVRSMKHLQDEVNARRAKMMWQLSTVRTFIEEDAVSDHAATAAEIARPDAYIKLNKNRKNNKTTGITVEEHAGLTSQQFQVYADAKQSIQQAAGVYGPMLGDANSGSEAGVAIDMLIQQGQTTLAEINDNYRFARTEVGRKLLAMKMKDMAGKPKKVTLQAKVGQSRSMTLNRPAIDKKTGVQYFENDVTRMLTKVALADVPNNVSYRQQRLKDLVEYAKSLPPELQVVFSDIVIMASDLKDKDIIADRIRKITGQSKPIDPASASPEELAELQQEQAAQQAQAQKQAEMEAIAKADALSKIHKTMASTEKERAATGNLRIQSLQIVSELGKGTPDVPATDTKPGQPGEEPMTLQEMAAAAQIVEASEDTIPRDENGNAISPAAPVRPGSDRLSMGAGMPQQ
jgi:hypothetical protein